MTSSTLVINEAWALVNDAAGTKVVFWLAEEAAKAWKVISEEDRKKCRVEKVHLVGDGLGGRWLLVDELEWVEPHDSARDELRARALAKLDPEERAALGLAAP